MKKSPGITRRGFLLTGAATAVPARLAFRAKRIVELVPNAAQGGMRLVERIVWVAR